MIKKALLHERLEALASDHFDDSPSHVQAWAIVVALPWVEGEGRESLQHACIRGTQDIRACTSIEVAPRGSPQSLIGRG